MRKAVTFFLISLFLCGVINIGYADAATVNASSCSQADVEAAISSASDADTVAIPSGSCLWSNLIMTNKGITLQGAGIGVTTITCGAGTSCLEIRNTAGGSPFRVTAFTWSGANTTSAKGIIHSQSTDDNWRIDNNKFANITTRGININSNNENDSSYGVVDHNTFEAPYELSAHGVDVVGDRDTAWTRAYTPGTANAVYIEDNTFNYAYKNDGVGDGYSGARIVFRYNTVTGTNLGVHGLDSGNRRSTHTIEYYNNTFDANGGTFANGIRLRGATGVIFNNTFTNGYNNPLRITSYRSCNSYPTWGICDGSNPLDGNEDSTGYPCMDQVGRSTGQALEPIYTWGNTKEGATIDMVAQELCVNNTPNVADHLKEDRDFYNKIQKPGYTPYTYPHPLTTTPNPPIGNP